MEPQQRQTRGSENQDTLIIYESDFEVGGHQQSRQHQLVSHIEQQGSSRPELVLSKKLKPWYTARSILGIFCIVLSLALLGLGIKLAVKYESAPLIHVTVAFTVFTAGASLLWSSVEFVAMCTRVQRRGIYPGAHVGVHMGLCLVCVAVVGYVGIWVSHGQARWVEASRNSLEYSPLYHMGVVILIISSVLLLVHFVLSILACQELRQKDDGDMHRTVVTVRYDGVGPTGTARPMGYRTAPETIGLPVYTTRDHHDETTMIIRSPPIVIARGDLGVEIAETPSTTRTVLGEMEMEALQEKPVGSSKR
ncbi:hypothetical protein QBC36DRAFT_37558 [Triangularia setosa]|uniref:Uncharacterized protein n=1 Tax=Triangularia setosa TaxID=2587417 RepID=A0AAN7A6Y1_9PEZI|nr:hypothetical protein QBC36DRAFT_37558 [Podospora setosa]